MFARIIEMTVKPEKKTEFVNTIKDQILPILNNFNGMLDVIHLEVETDPTLIYALTFWHEKPDMERYVKEGFPKVKAMLDPLLVKPLVGKVCKVNETISKKKLITVAA